MLCFVIMPFGDRIVDSVHFEKMESLYSEFIKPTVESVKLPGKDDIQLQCHRADKELGSGDIVDHVIESLITARIVIADLTGRNSNVFYELGVRHAVSNATILIAEGTQHIPFDVHTLRSLVYEYTPSGMVRFQRQLRETLDKILSSPEKIDNPVRRMLYHKESAKLVAQQAPPGFDIVQSLLTEMTGLRAEIRGQRNEIGSLLEAITKTPLAAPLDRFEGIWYSDDTDSTFCMKVVKNELRVAYSYGGRNDLTSHFYNCQVIGDLLACRFQWFDNKDTMGFVVLRFTDVDRLEGGWCYADDLPSRKGVALRESRDLPVQELLALTPILYKLILRRKPHRPFPKWAEAYFRRYEHTKMPNKGGTDKISS